MFTMLGFWPSHRAVVPYHYYLSLASHPPSSSMQPYQILFHVTCCLWSPLGSGRLFCEADMWPERERCLLNSHDSIPAETLLGKSSVKPFTVYPNLKHTSRDHQIELVSYDNYMTTKSPETGTLRSNRYPSLCADSFCKDGFWWAGKWR